MLGAHGGAGYTFGAELWARVVLEVGGAREPLAYGACDEVLRDDVQRDGLGQQDAPLEEQRVLAAQRQAKLRGGEEEQGRVPCTASNATPPARTHAPLRKARRGSRGRASLP